jgi:hypothetical protein
MIDYISQATDRFYALPDPLHTILVSNETPSGSKDVFIDFNIGDGLMGGMKFIDTTFSRVTYTFRFSSIGDVYSGGTLRNIVIGLYRDQECLDPITYTQLNNGETLSLGTEEVSRMFSGSLTNNTGLLNIYCGIYWNNQLQYTTIPMASPDLPDKTETE